MPDPVTPDPFVELARSVEPIAPSTAFAAELRGRVERLLGRTTPAASRLPYLPDGFSAITPYLAVRDARAAMTFYEEVFGAVVEGEPIIMDDDRVGHAQLRIGDAVLFMADEFPEIGVVSPLSHEGSSVSFVVYVPDVDAAFERARTRGAVVERPVEDGQHGSRAGWLRDPFGHRWNIGTPQDLPSRPLRTDEVDLGLRAPIPGEDPPRTGGEDDPHLGYFALGSPDAAASRAFLADLFGWVFEGEAVHGGHIAGSVPPGGLHDDEAPSTTVFIRVADARAYARRVVELGGSTEPATDHASGLNISCRDPLGVPFVLWEPAAGY